MAFDLDSHSKVINPASRSKIQGDYRPAVDLALSQIKSNLPEKEIVSIYLRGSVGCGKAIRGISDIDIVTITRAAINDVNLKWRQKSNSLITARYPFITLVDFAVISENELLHGEKYHNLQIYLKTCSVKLYGKEILPKIPAVIPGRELALRMYPDLNKEMSKLKEKFLPGVKDLSYSGQDRPISFWCVWTARVLIRSGLALSMINEQIYTPDLKECYSTFSKHYKNMAPGMKKALRYAISPTDDRQEMIRFFEGYIDQYLELFSKSLYVPCKKNRPGV